MVTRPDLFEGGNQYQDYSDQFNSREEEIDMVKDNFDKRRKFSAEGFKVKIGFVDNFLEDWVIVQEYTNPLNEEKDVRQMHLPIDLKFKRGMYVYWLDEPWLIMSEKKYIDGAYWSVQIRKCNYLLKWMNKITHTIVSHWCTVISKNSYSSGVWSNTFAQYVDGETACFIPSGIKDVKYCVRGDRFLIDDNEINPSSFAISNIKNVVMDGITILNFSEDEPSHVYDDYKNMIANRYRYENSYKIIVLNGDSFSIGLNQNAQLQTKVESFNELMGTTTIVDSPILSYKPINENILKILPDGTVIPNSVGSTFIDIILKSNSTDKFDTITQKRIEITIENTIVVETKLEIIGSDKIFFDMKAKYTAVLFKNGLENNDTFEFKLLNEFDLPLSDKFAKLTNITNNTCEVQVYDSLTNIKLVAKSLFTQLEKIKIISIRDIL